MDPKTGAVGLATPIPTLPPSTNPLPTDPVLRNGKSNNAVATSAVRPNALFM